MDESPGNAPPTQEKSHQRVRPALVESTALKWDVVNRTDAPNRHHDERNAIDESDQSAATLQFDEELFARQRLLRQ